MKPKDLKCPVTWASRRPLIHEGVLFVPPYYQRHDEWNKGPLFEDDKPVCLEYCSGNGDWVIGKALSDPTRNWIAVEKRFDRVRKIWSKMRNQSISNLLIVCGEAQAFTRHYVLPGTIQEIYINFPDPWPKRVHAKHRLFQPEFIENMAQAITKDGSACFVTDDPNYSAQMVAEMLKCRLWKPLLPAPYYKLEWPDYGYSFFDQLWRAKGCEIRYHLFSRGTA